jgi:anthranilate synthase component 1
LGPIRFEKLAGTYDLFTLFKRINLHYENVFILESLEGPKELAETSIVGFDPDVKISCDTEKFKVKRKGKRTQAFPVTDPLEQLKQQIPIIREGDTRFVGGAVGYISYDAVRYWERLPKRRLTKTFPLLEFGVYFDGILYNHRESQAHYFYRGKSRLNEIEKKIASSRKSKMESFNCSKPKRNLNRKQFHKIVESARKYIYDGDIFQVVLAKRLSFRLTGDLLTVYQRLREVNPSPYMYFLKSSKRCIIGSSPEMLLRVTNGLVETFPIAGTRPVVNDPSKNDEYGRDLLNDEKELAEHTMLVDLARNDIGRVCDFGSVNVRELMVVKKFSHVQHIVSHVTGKLGSDKDSFDALKAVFPAGTVSGAPKVRAMEIIDELEVAPRGPYAGALGYFSFNGSCDFAITIRSIFVSGKTAFVQSGAGIVMDSDPEKEWIETENKAGAMLAALNIK